MKNLVWLLILFNWAGISFAQLSTDKIGAAGDEYTFIRVKYDNANHFSNDGWGSWSSWSVDFPDADINFLRGVKRLTNIHINAEPAVLTLNDDRIFEHPFLYMLEMGRFGGPDFSEKDVQNLREYLLRGGFLFVDDFWGTFEWQTFYQAFSRVFPDRPVVELDKDHQVFHSFYDIEGPQMIPSIRNSFYNQPESDVDHAVNQAIMDDDGRVMVLINWNSDIGDGWEHTYSPEYSTKYANMAYQLGINYLIYAMTH
ncbi:MAG: DUF4159 domain-containing protein [SAR324 cluster bacterium]|nr:DUF4159 domain-containing protein [SAR324 cluster bacterium]